MSDKADEDAAEKQKKERLRAERQELYAKNQPAAVKQSRAELRKNKSKLKADVKRTTGFVKKSRTLSDDNYANLLADIEKLNLTRYVSEVVGAILEVNKCLTSTLVVKRWNTRKAEPEL